MAAKGVKNSLKVSSFVPLFFQRPISFLYSILVLAVATFALYVQALDNPIFFDTAQTFNDQVLNDYFDLTTWRSLLTSRWLSQFVFGVTYKLVGVQWGWHHLINIVIHLSNAAMVCYLVRLVMEHIQSKDEVEGQIHFTWSSLFVGLLFAVNPLSIYATGYLIQRTSLMMTFFSLSGMVCYFLAVTRNNTKYLIATICCYYLSYLSKEHGIMLPAVLVAFHFFIDRISFSDFIKRYGWFYFCLGLITFWYVFGVKQLLATVYEPHGDQMIESANLKDSVLTHESAYALSIITQMGMFFRYLYLWFVPDWRNIYIDIHLPFASQYISFPETLFVIGFLLYPVLCVWMMLRKNVHVRMAGMGLISIWLFSFPEYSTVRLSEQFVLYRCYLWMSVAAFVWPVVILWKNSSKIVFYVKSITLVVYVIVSVIVCYDRLNTFDSDIALWRDNTQKMKNVDASAMYKGYRPYNNLAFALTSAGFIDESIQYYYQALQINPRYVKARSNLGAVLTNRGRFQEAIEHFKKAIELDPEYVDAHVGIGVCAAEQGFTEEAIEHYMNALKVKPEYPDALFNMGNAYLKLKQFDKAADLYVRSIKQKPNFPDSYHNLGIAYSNMGKFIEAKKAFEDAQRIDPNHKKSRDALNMISQQIPNLQTK